MDKTSCELRNFLYYSLIQVSYKEHVFVFFIKVLVKMMSFMIYVQNAENDIHLMMTAMKIQIKKFVPIVVYPTTLSNIHLHHQQRYTMISICFTTSYLLFDATSSLKNSISFQVTADITCGPRYVSLCEKAFEIFEAKGHLMIFADFLR